MVIGATISYNQKYAENKLKRNSEIVKSDQLTYFDTLHSYNIGLKYIA